MKISQFVIVLCMVSGMAAKAQPPEKWTISVNKKKVAEGTADAPGDASISLAAKGTVIIKYSGSPKNDNRRSILIFDTERHQLLKKEIKRNYGKFTFNIDTLKAKTNGRKFEIYTIAIPNDPEKAAMVRLRPMLLCVMAWKQ